MTTRSAIVALAIAGSAIVLGAAPRQGASPDAAKDAMVVVGVACGDRTFVPLAALTKGRWAALIEADERVSLQYFFGVLTHQARRLPRQGWTLYPLGAGAPKPLMLRSRGADPDAGQCFYTQAFNSDAPRVTRRVVLLDRTETVPQVGGMGVLGPARFEYGQDVTAQPDENSRRVAERIVRNVHAIERRLLRESHEDSPLEPFAGRKEVRSVVRLMTMTRHRSDDGEWYFFQARKQYGEWYVFEGKRMYRDWARLLVHGWVRSSSAGLSVHGLAGGFVDDDWKVSRVYRMTGVLVLDDRAVWIAEGNGYESLWYELFEMRPGDKAPHSVVTVLVHAS
jgi:hypothetical protein